MKKLFNFLAIAAVALSMASCGEDVSLSNFTIETESVKPAYAKLTIAPANEGTCLFRYAIEYKNTFLRNKDSMRETLKQKGSAVCQTSVEQEYYSLVPETEYTVYVCETDQNGNPVGELEYFSFKTPTTYDNTLPLFREDGINRFEELEGLTAYADGRVTISALAKNEKGMEFPFDASFYASSVTGPFKINDAIRRYKETFPYVGARDSKSMIKYEIFDANIKGSVDPKTGKCVYTGWIVAYVNQLRERFTVHIECTDVSK